MSQDSSGSIIPNFSRLFCKQKKFDLKGPRGADFSSPARSKQEKSGIIRRNNIGRLRILIASGASAGHLYPALALAQCLKKTDPGLDIAFVTSRRQGLHRFINEEGYKLFFISIINFQSGFIKSLRAFYLLIKSFLESFLVIEKFRPDAVVGFGSYVSLPLLLEASLLKKPTIIHEQNISLGIANRLLSLFTDKIAVSFKETKAPVGAYGKFVRTGYPLRAALVRESRDKAAEFFGLKNKFTVLIIGGSQGAQRINLEFKSALGLLGDREDFQFIHVTGSEDYLTLRKAYQHVRINHCIFEFLPQMHMAYSMADLAICRAGAGTIAELAYFGMPVILIPYPRARGHQLENALALLKAGAAIVIEEKALSASLLYESILNAMCSPGMLRDLGEKIAGFTGVRADEKLANEVLGLLAND